MTRLRWLAAAALAFAACDSDHYLVVTVTGRPSVHDIATLRLTLGNEGSMRTDDFPFAGQKLPVTFAVSSPDRTGELAISAQALDGNMFVIGTGAADSSFEADSATVAMDGADFVVNTSFADDQVLSDDFNANGNGLSATPDGGWLAAFHDKCSAPCQMLGRRFDSTGRAVQSTAAASDQAFALTTEPTTDATPATAANDQGTIAVWNYNDGTTQGVACRAIDATGAALGDQVSLAVDNADVVVATAVQGGNFVVAWNSFASPEKIDAVIVKPTCQLASGAVISVATAGTGEFFSVPVIASAPNGSVMFAWNDADNIMGYASRTAVGFAGTPKVLVASTATDRVVYSRLVPLGDGFALFARWVPKSNMGEGRIDMTLFDAQGNPTGGAPILISNTTGGDFATVDSFAAASDGTTALVVWHGCGGDGDGNGCGVKGHYATTAGAVGSDFVIPTTITGDQKSPSAVALGAGTFAVAWNDFSGQMPDISGAAVRAKIVYADATGGPTD